MFIPLFLILNGDAVACDSISLDSIEVYQIPDYINLGEVSPRDSFFSILKINPRDYDLTLTDAISGLPLFSQKDVCRVVIFSPFRFDFRLNGHSLRDCFFGGVSPALLPIQSLKTIGIKTRKERYEHSLELTTRVFEYERPFSRIFFTMFGSDKVYNIDFGRALGRNSFIYLSGVYSNFFDRFDTLFLKTNSFYANFYHNQFLPARFDFFYAGSNYNGFLNSTLLDGNVTLGNRRNKIAFFHTLYTNAFTDNNCDTIIKNAVRKICLYEESYLNPKGFEIRLGINGAREFLTGDFYNRENCSYLSFWQDLERSLSPFLFGFFWYWEIDKDGQSNFSPCGFGGSRIYDSTFIILSWSLNHYKPTISQRSGLPAPFYSNYFLNPNPGLKPERFLRREVQLKNRNLFLNFYTAEITNYIYYHPDSFNYYTPQNLDFLPAKGLEGYFQSSLFFNSFVEFAGNYLFQYSPLQYIPRGYASLEYLWQKKTPRSVIGLGMRLRYAQKMTGPFGEDYEPFYIITPFISIKFITLSISLTLNNILNKSVPAQNLKGREFIAIIKWDFWD